MSLLGNGQSELEDWLADALKTQNRVISPDPQPEKGGFFRSDHFSLARFGIPSISPGGGFDLVDGGTTAGKAVRDDYRAPLSSALGRVAAQLGHARSGGRRLGALHGGRHARQFGFVAGLEAGQRVQGGLGEDEGRKMRAIVRAALLVSLLMPGAARAAVTISPAYAQVVAGRRCSSPHRPA